MHRRIDILVKIKTWNKMEQEYGLNKDVGINRYNPFTKKIEKNLPKNRIILIEYNYINKVYTWKKGIQLYVIMDYMIEKFLTSKEYPQYFI
jgi:hypothetical protein